MLKNKPFEKDGVLYKECNMCNEVIEFNTENFYKEKRNKYGLKAICKKCFNVENSKIVKNYSEDQKKRRSEAVKKRIQNKKDQYSKMWKLYKERNCEKIAAQKKEYNGRECVKERRRQLGTNQKNKEIARKSSKEYSYTKKDFLDACKYFDNSCAYCGKKNKLQMEHIIPFSKNGTSKKNNIIPSCINCNCQKHKQDFEDWYPRQKFFTEDRYNNIKEFIKNN